MMRFVPDSPNGDDELPPHVRVGPTPAGRAVPLVSLGNEPGLAVPAALGADTAAGVALNALRDPDLAGRLGAIGAVTAAGFNGGHLLAVWALCQPEAALARATALADAARAAEFGVARSAEAAQIACLFRSYRAERGIGDDASLYADLLPRIAGLLDRPRDFDLYWIGHYSDVLQSESMLHSGAVQIEEHDDLDLTVMITPLRLDDITRFTAARGFRLFTVRSENTYTLEYRRESWVRFRSCRPLPRIDLRPLAARLNLFERGSGVWRADPITVPIPRLYLDQGDGRAAPSMIDAETVIAEVLDHLRAGARRRDWQWSPFAET